jgi:thiamine biosynthesis lipoprotein
MRSIAYSLLAILMLIVPILGCDNAQQTQAYTKYSGSFYDTFDTITQVVGYTHTQQEFDQYLASIHTQFRELHQLYDIYNSYDGVVNIKTINDNAGMKPVVVDQRIMDLILFARQWNERTGTQTNIAMGSVLKIWDTYREDGVLDPVNAKLPPMLLLKKAEEHTDNKQIILDENKGTVYLTDPMMSLNVGAIAKGYATELVAKAIMNEGLTSGIISSGGNVRVLGKPLDHVRERWGVGIQNPDQFIALEEENLLDTIFLNYASVVSSGDYQRYYVVDGTIVHHIIDPATLMPAQHYRAVTIVTEDSGVADYLSTTAFILPYQESRALIDSLDGVEAIWVFHDGKVEATDGMKQIMKSHGATGAKAL